MNTHYPYKARNKGLEGALAFLLCAVSLLAGCKKLVQIPAPTTELASGSVLSNNNTATAAVLNVYDQMFSHYESFSMAEAMGSYADELTVYDNTNDVYTELYTNSLLATQSPGPWVNAYNYIYQANSMISGLQTTGGCSPAVKQQLTGESYFIRAFWHFYLTNIYGDVPLVLTSGYSMNATLPRTPRVTVLKQVAADLQTADSLLNSNYVDISDTATTTERVRPNQAAAQALLARVYLYLGDYSQNPAYYAEADSVASLVISNGNYSLSPLNGVFLANSTEAIWQIQTPQPPPPADTYDGYYFILLGAPVNYTDQNGTSISPQLLGAFEPNDQRQTIWISSISGNGTTFNFPFKYQQNTYVGLEYTMVLRLGEQYLIRAEARTHDGNLTGANQDLDTIRNRAGLADTLIGSAPALLAAILHERQVELFTEWGARWFDLCRTGNANAVMGAPGNVCSSKGGVWGSSGDQLLFPLPLSDVLADPNLHQNSGY
jgi:hypothetical protein